MSLGGIDARKNHKRPEFTTALIVCAGKSEKIYFSYLIRDHYDLPAVKVRCVSETKCSAVNVVMSVTEGRIKNIDSEDKIFCVVDYETPQHTDQPKALQMLNDYKTKTRRDIALITSRPCLEFWFLQHFKPTNRDFTGCQEVKQEIKRSHIEDYTEGHEGQVKSMIAAVSLPEVAQKTRKFHEAAESESHSDIYKIIEFLEEQQRLKSA